MDEKYSPKATEVEEKKVERDPSVGTLNRTEVCTVLSAHLQFAINIMKAIAGSGILTIPYAVQKVMIVQSLHHRSVSSRRFSSSPS